MVTRTWMRLSRVVGNETLDVVDLRLESQRRESLGVSTGVSMLWRAGRVCRRVVGDKRQIRR